MIQYHSGLPGMVMQEKKVIAEIEKIITTPDSHPFAAAVHKLDFAENGYQEDEYFIRGTANVYTGDSGINLKIVHQSVPYCNRVLIRHPSDYSKISGDIVVEILTYVSRIPVDAVFHNKTDEFGNAVGGVRSPFIDIPACTYYNYSNQPEKRNPEKFNYLFGHTVPFSAEQLRKLYGTLENYRQLVERSADSQIFLVSDDKEDAVEEAVKNAKRWGLN